MGRLKKGSAAAKAWGRKMKKLRTSKGKKSRSAPLRRKKSIKYKKRTMPKKKRKASRKSPNFFGINLTKAAAAGIYGAFRARSSALLAPYTSKIPIGAVSDEVGLVVAAQLLKKMVFKRAGIAKDVLNIGQMIEFARIGEAAISGQINLGALTPQTNSGNLF